MKKDKYLDIKFGTSAAPVSKEISEAIEKGTINLDSEEDLDEFIKGVQNIQESKFERAASINLLNINNGKNTIEFRVANGTINPDTWIENVRLFGRIVQVSEKIAHIEKSNQTELTEQDKRLLNLMEQLKENKPEPEKMEVLLEMLFTEEERIVYRERYNENSRKIEEKSKEGNESIENLRFAGKVEFKKKRHSIDEFSDISIKNRGGYIDTTRETKEAVEQERRGQNSGEIENNKKGERND